MSPWGLFFAYHVCGAHMHSAHREGSDEPEIVKILKETFLAIDVRWNVAGTLASSAISSSLIACSFLVQVFISSCWRHGKLGTVSGRETSWAGCEVRGWPKKKEKKSKWRIYFILSK